MSVECTFRRDDHALREAQSSDDSGLFTETLVVIPVRLRVGNSDVLVPSPTRPAPSDLSTGPEGESIWIATAPADHGWVPQPAIGFLTGVRAAIQAAAAGRTASAYLAGLGSRLSFAPAGGDMLSVRLGEGAPAIASVDEFELAIGEFTRGIADWIAEVAPELRRHPSWKDWFGEHD